MTPELLLIRVVSLIEVGGLVAIVLMLREMRAKNAADTAATYLQDNRIADVIGEMRRELLESPLNAKIPCKPRGHNHEVAARIWTTPRFCRLRSARRLLSRRGSRPLCDRPVRVPCAGRFAPPMPSASRPHKRTRTSFQSRRHPCSTD